MGAGEVVGSGTGPMGGVGVGVTLGEGSGDGLGLMPGDGEGVGVGITILALAAAFSRAAPPAANATNVPPTTTIKRTINRQKRPVLLRSVDINFISSLRVRFCRSYLYDMNFYREDVNYPNRSCGFLWCLLFSLESQKPPARSWYRHRQ